MVKAGRTEAAARTARSHTGSLAGADVVFDAFCRQAGIARCDSLAALCETLKILHTGGPLRGRRALILGASGGDMAMTADAARDLGVEFSAIPDTSVTKLREILTDKVTIANPFDFHTHIWFDRPALRALFSTVQRAGFDAVGFMIDCPSAAKADPASYIAAIEEFIAAYPGSTARGAIISSLPESMAPETREMCLAAGIVPLQGQRQALEALDLAANIGEAWSSGSRVELRLPRYTVGAEPAGRESHHPGASAARARTLAEYEGKAALAAFGVRTPQSRVVSAKDAPGVAEEIGFPVVMKAASATLEHKSDVGGVIINIRSRAEAEAAAQRLAKLSGQVLVEEMIADAVVEILIGMTSDAQFGQVLVLGAGGVLTELLRDTVSLLPPFTASAIEAAIKRLAIGKLLTGYRGRPPADVPALVETALACTRYAAANVDTLLELDINPVIVRPAGRGAVAVDALIRLA
jgi:acetyl-CoA synthetase